MCKRAEPSSLVTASATAEDAGGEQDYDDEDDEDDDDHGDPQTRGGEGDDPAPYGGVSATFAPPNPVDERTRTRNDARGPGLPTRSVRLATA